VLNAPTVPMDAKALAAVLSQALSKVWSSVAVEVVVDTGAHGWMHLEVVDLFGLDPADLAGFAAGGRFAAGGACGEDDGELLAGFSVAGVEDDVAGVGVDADEPGDFAVDSGFFEGFAYCGLRHGLAEILCSAWERPIVIVGSSDEQDSAGFIGDYDVGGGNDAIGFRGVRVVEVVDSA
jgi:hypothetical protein